MPMMRRVGRPGLIGTAARTAVIAGTAQAVGGGVARRQNERALSRQQAAYEQQEAAYRQQVQTQPVSQLGGADSGDVVAQLEQLAKLRSAGAPSEAEFEAAKSKLLGV